MHKGIVTGVLGVGIAAYSVMLDGILIASALKILVAGPIAVVAVAIALPHLEEVRMSFLDAFGLWSVLIASACGLVALGRLTSYWAASTFFDSLMGPVAYYGFWTGVATMALGLVLLIIDDVRLELIIA